MAPPFRIAEFDIIFGEGVSAIGELVDLAVENDIIDKSGSWFSYGDIKIGQGRDSAKIWLSENDALRAEVTHRVKEAIGMLPVPESTNGVAEDVQLAVPADAGSAPTDK